MSSRSEKTKPDQSPTAPPPETTDQPSPAPPPPAAPKREVVGVVADGRAVVCRAGTMRAGDLVWSDTFDADTLDRFRKKGLVVTSRAAADAKR